MFVAITLAVGMAARSGREALLAGRQGAMAFNHCQTRYRKSRADGGKAWRGHRGRVRGRRYAFGQYLAYERSWRRRRSRLVGYGTGVGFCNWVGR